MPGIFNIIIAVVVVVIVLVVVVKSAFVVRQQEEVIIERLGNFHRTAKPGLHLKVPFIDRIVQKVSLRTHKKELELDAKTQDNVIMKIRVSTQYHVDWRLQEDVRNTGVYRSYYTLADPLNQMADFVSDALRSAIPKHSLDEVYDEKEAIAKQVKETVAEAMRSYGYEIVQTLITDITPPVSVEAAMNDINAAVRQKAAAEEQALANKIKMEVEAEGKANAMKLNGQGIANHRKAIAEGFAESMGKITEAGVSPEEANALLKFMQWVSMMEEFAKNGKHSTVLLSPNFNDTNDMVEPLIAAFEASKQESQANG